MVTQPAFYCLRDRGMDLDPAANSAHALEGATIAECLRVAAIRAPDATYLTTLSDGQRFSFREVEEVSRRLAHGLRGCGIGKATHVAVMMANSAEHVFVLFALARIGAVASLVNTAAKGDLLRHFLVLSRATAMIADDEYALRLADLPPEASEIRTLIVAGEDRRPVSNNGVVCRSLTDLFESRRAEEPALSVEPADPAHIIFTSGTTGPSKGVLYSQARSLFYAHDIAQNYRLSAADRVYCWMPLFHASGLHGALLSTLLVGGSVALSPRFSASRFIAEAAQSQSTVAIHQGATLNMLWAQPPTRDDRRHGVRLCLAVPVPPFADAYEARFAMPLSACYGLTDCGMPTWLPADAPKEKRGSCGRPTNGWQIAILDENDGFAPPGAVGEIAMRNDVETSNSAVYYGDGEATARAWRGGWFHTGDLGRLDDDGYLWYVGRLKDCIRRRGENISAFEVEQILLKHPAVAEVAVFPVASDMSEEEVAAAVIRRPGAAVAERELAEFCVENLPHYMVPRFLRFVSELPRNLSQRVQKFVLTAEAKADMSRLWDREKAGVTMKR
jgi:crotonobetaine/carnitine-CoA ligase